MRAGHPWIFSRAIAAGLGDVEPGEPVRVVAAGGAFVAAGYAHPRTPIAVRVLTLDDEPVDDRLVARRVDEALALRRALLPPELAAYRVINGEGDRLPGMVVDRYGDVLVCQLFTAGAARLGPALVDALVERLAPRTVVERSAGAVRAEEGLPGVRATRFGDPPPARLEIEEAGCRYLVDVLHGQKTGFFLDQRESRLRLRALARRRRVLNLFAYTGAFAVAAGVGGAEEVVSVDTSRPALALAEAAWAANGLDPARARVVAADVFEFLRAERETFDVVVCDPPPFIRRRRDHDAGVRGYRDVNLHAVRRVRPGGWLMTSSCSQHLARAELRAVVAQAVAAAGRVATVVAEGGAPPDHPVALAHPEGEYLKVLWLRV